MYIYVYIYIDKQKTYDFIDIDKQRRVSGGEMSNRTIFVFVAMSFVCPFIYIYIYIHTYINHTKSHYVCVCQYHGGNSIGLVSAPIIAVDSGFVGNTHDGWKKVVSM